MNKPLPTLTQSKGANMTIFPIRKKNNIDHTKQDIQKFLFESLNKGTMLCKLN